MAVVLLDAGLLMLAICAVDGRDPIRDSEILAFQAWLEAKASVVHDFAVVDVTRFEVLRGLHHRPNQGKLRRFEDLTSGMSSLAVELSAWDRAARLWGGLRRQGKSTADARTLDGDTILASVAQELTASGEVVVVATTNVKHLTWAGVDARPWREVPDRI